MVGFDSGSSGSWIREELSKGGEVPFRRTSGWWFLPGVSVVTTAQRSGPPRWTGRMHMKSCFLSLFLCVPKCGPAACVAVPAQAGTAGGFLMVFPFGLFRDADARGCVPPVHRITRNVQVSDTSGGRQSFAAAREAQRKRPWGVPSPCLPYSPVGRTGSLLSPSSRDSMHACTLPDGVLHSSLSDGGRVPLRNARYSLWRSLADSTSIGMIA